LVKQPGVSQQRLDFTQQLCNLTQKNIVGLTIKDGDFPGRQAPGQRRSSLMLLGAHGLEGLAASRPGRKNQGI